MGKYLFVMPWGSMELDIEEDEQGLHVVMTSPERNMTVVPEVAERRGDVIVLEAGAGDYGMHFELRDNGNGYDVIGRIPVVGEISGKAAPAEQVAAEEKKRKEEMEQFLAREREKEPVKRSEEEIDALVEELLSKMTLEEKIGQMTQSGGLDTSAIGNEVEQKLPLKEQIRRGLLGSMIAMASPVDLFELQKLAVEESRLGIPLLYCRDVIHGQETVFPIPLAWACSFDPGLVQEAAAAAAREASSIGVMVAFAPMLDIARDPRWGRIAEGHGEDPYLDARMGEAVVRGYQGDDLLKKDTVGACLKHFLGYGAVEGGRDYNTCEISEVTLRNTYLPPFSAGVRAGASMVMSAFTVLNGRPITASRQYLHDLLRDELGFDGCVVSDYGAVAETIVHGCAEDGADAAVKCLDASVDMEMATGLYVENLPAKVREGVVSEEQIDAAVRRILKLKYQLGVMDCPYRYLRPEDEKEIFSEEKRALSRKLAGESMVLLKNDGLLPVAKDKKIALIGPKAESKDLLGTWQSSTKGSETVTLLEGLTNAGYEVSAVSTAKTGELSEDERARIEAAMTAADVILLALGEDSEDSGEASCLQKIDLPDLQRELAKIACDSGKPVAAVLVSGRPQVITELTGKANAILEAWFPGCEAGNAIADIISGDVNPSGKLCVSFPKALGQVPVYYNHLNTGRPQLEEGRPFLTGYLDGSMRPLYDFGYGLSYTSFAVENVKLSAEIFHPGDTLTVTADVVNTGERSGAEVLQLYIHDVAASIARPVKELKGFERVELAPGERRQITFALTAETFSFCGLELKETIEPGKVEIFLGTSSRDCDLDRMEIVIEM